MLKQLVEYIVKQLVDKPDMVAVVQREDNGKSILDIRVASQDVKRVIGKEGRIVRAIRMMVNCVQQEKNIEINLDSPQQ